MRQIIYMLYSTFILCLFFFFFWNSDWKLFLLVKQETTRLTAHRIGSILPDFNCSNTIYLKNGLPLVSLHLKWPLLLLKEKPFRSMTLCEAWWKLSNSSIFTDRLGFKPFIHNSICLFLFLFWNAKSKKTMYENNKHLQKHNWLG